MNREMIDSGVEWIGEIPSTWDTSRIGAEYKVRNEKVSDKNYMPLSVTKLTEGIVPQMDQVAKSDAHDDRKLVLKGDFVINSRSDRKMACGVSNYDGSVSLINIVLKSVGKISPNYTHYLLKNYAFAEEFYKWGHGIVADLWTTNSSDFKRITIPVPSDVEQHKIVETLDRKISQIDKLIANQEKQIAKLKEFLECIIYKYLQKELGLNIDNKGFTSKEPLYKLGSLAWLVTKQTGFDYSNIIKPTMLDSPNEDSLPYLQTRNFKNNDFNFNTEFYVPKETWKQFPRLILKNDTLLFSIVGASIGNVAVFPRGQKAFLGGAICRVDLNDVSYANYIKEIMLSKFGQEQIFRKINSNAQGTITVQNVREFLIPIPSREKMEVMENKCTTLRNDINKLIVIKQNKIEKIIEYKKSLIYEYVTGKKDFC